MKIAKKSKKFIYNLNLQKKVIITFSNRKKL